MDDECVTRVVERVSKNGYEGLGTTPPGKGVRRFVRDEVSERIL
jgi:hypothetical protein